jgi:glycerol-3-phosphate acyltransferase PlsY
VRTATLVAVAVAVAVGYLVGSVPVAVLVGRRHRVDPRAVGDRNPGWWNVRAQLGTRRAVPVLVGDTAKGVLAAAVAVLVAPDGAWGVGYAGVAAAMIGHAWPVFAGFRGGRSILVFAGGMCVLAPVPALLAVAVFALLSLLGRTALGARVGVFGFPVLQLVLESPNRVAATGGLMCIIGARFGLAAVAARRDGRPAAQA